MRHYLIVKKTVKIIIFISIISILAEGFFTFYALKKQAEKAQAVDSVACQADALGSIQSATWYDSPIAQVKVLFNVNQTNTGSYTIKAIDGSSTIYEKSASVETNSLDAGLMIEEDIQIPNMPQNDNIKIQMQFISRTDSGCTKTDERDVYVGICREYGSITVSANPSSVDIRNEDGTLKETVPPININYSFSGHGSDYFHLFIEDCHGQSWSKEQGTVSDGSRTFSWVAGTSPEEAVCNHRITIKTFKGGPGSSESACMTGLARTDATVTGPAGDTTPGPEIPGGEGAGGDVAITGTISVFGTSFSIPKSIGGIGSLFEKILTLLGTILGALALISLSYGGIQYITSAGDQAKAEKAKKTIIYSVAGIILAVMAYTITVILINIKNGPPTT